MTLAEWEARHKGLQSNFPQAYWPKAQQVNSTLVSILCQETWLHVEVHYGGANTAESPWRAYLQ